MQDWRVALLKQLGAPATKQNLDFLGTWQRWEGGHTNNSAKFNWLNTTRNAPGATGSINSVGVKAFDSFNSGVAATAATLQSGLYKDIVAALVSGNPQQAKPVAGLSTWLSGSPNSAAGAKYASKVLGVDARPQEVKGKAQEAYAQGPASVVNSPSPRDLLANFQQQASQAIFAAGSSDWFGAMMGLAQAKQGLAAAGAEFAAAEGRARQDGGTIQDVAGGPELEGSSDLVRNILKVADAQVGKPYVWGAESPKEGGFDCSGLIDWAFRQSGVKLPGGRLTTYTAARMGTSVKGKPMKPGDWIITGSGGHMVMYVGNGRVIAAPRRGEVVQYQPVSNFENNIMDVRRVLK